VLKEAARDPRCRTGAKAKRPVDDGVWRRGARRGGLLALRYGWWKAGMVHPAWRDRPGETSCQPLERSRRLFGWAPCPL